MCDGGASHGMQFVCYASPVQDVALKNGALQSSAKLLRPIIVYFLLSSAIFLLSSVTLPGFPKIRQHTKHSGVMLIWLSAILPSTHSWKRCPCHPNNRWIESTSSTGTTMTHHQLTCGEDSSLVVIREWRLYALTTTTLCYYCFQIQRLWFRFGFRCA